MALFAPNVRGRSPDGIQSGRGEVRAYYERLLQDDTKFRLSPLRVIADGTRGPCARAGQRSRSGPTTGRQRFP